MELRASALRRVALLALALLLLLARLECVASSIPTRRAEKSPTTTSTIPSSSSPPFASGATFTISSTEAFVTPEQQAALEAALPACVGLPAASDDGEEETTIQTSSATNAACGG